MATCSTAFVGALLALTTHHAQPPAAPPKGADSPAFKSPQEAGATFIATTTKKDWSATLKCFAPEARDLAAVQLITMFQFAATGVGKEREALDGILAKHGFDPKKSWAAAQEEAKASGTDRKKTDWHKFVATYASSIKDKSALFTELLRWADEHYANTGPPISKPVTLIDLKISGDTATGKLYSGTGGGWPVAFKKVGEQWLLVLPPEQFAPSGWNDGFLFDYLDAIHQWRF